MPPNWRQLQAVADAEVKATLLSLPERLRASAQQVPVTFEPRPNAAMIADGTEPDTLGLFVGAEFAAGESSAAPLPAQIILFLENLWEFSEADETVYREEIRTTVLHELGHYLGLDEDELEDRGLE